MIGPRPTRVLAPGRHANRSESPAVTVRTRTSRPEPRPRRVNVRSRAALRCWKHAWTTMGRGSRTMRWLDQSGAWTARSAPATTRLGASRAGAETKLRPEVSSSSCMAQPCIRSRRPPSWPGSPLRRAGGAQRGRRTRGRRRERRGGLRVRPARTNAGARAHGRTGRPSLSTHSGATCPTT